MHSHFLVLSLLLASGCVSLPRPTQREHDTIALAREAFEAHRGPVTCPALDAARVRNTGNPSYFCGEGAQACTIGPVITVLESAPLHDALVIHEALHIIRGCWVGVQDGPHFLERYRTGRTGCDHKSPRDHGHCDDEVWLGAGSIEFDATSRLQ